VIRAAAHVHTDWSYDGSWELEALVRELKRRGYGAVLTAEHDRTFDAERWERYRAACAVAEGAVGIPVCPGIEYSDADNVVHVPVWGVDLPFLGAGRESAGLIAEAAEAGAAVVLAHPGRKDAWRRLDSRSFERLSGVEAWNRKYDGWAPGPVGTELARTHSLAPFFGLDFHTHRQFFPLAMGIEAVAGASGEEVATALAAGRHRPLAFGREGGKLLGGPGHGAARAAEGARRAARPAVRKVRRMRGSDEVEDGARTN
jgi:predicted metal-dependent phosphoesterase TrpH